MCRAAAGARGGRPCHPEGAPATEGSTRSTVDPSPAAQDDTAGVGSRAPSQAHGPSTRSSAGVSVGASVRTILEDVPVAVNCRGSSLLVPPLAASLPPQRLLGRD